MGSHVGKCRCNMAPGNSAHATLPPPRLNDADEEIHNLEKLLITITIRGVVENSQLFRVYSPTATTTA